jgi:hypothetical protein
MAQGWFDLAEIVRDAAEMVMSLGEIGAGGSMAGAKLSAACCQSPSSVSAKPNWV